MRKEYDFSTGTRGPVIPSPGKTALTIMLDDDIIEFFRTTAETQGTGYQSLINAHLRTAMTNNKAFNSEQIVTIHTLRAILREELQHTYANFNQPMSNT
jgi:hypothetical protein